MRLSFGLMTASAVFLAVLGIACTFAPQEILSVIAAGPATSFSLPTQLVGALYLGFAFLNWSTRSNLIGGIYGRPLVIGNLMHFLVGGLALLRFALEGNAAFALWVLTVAYLAFATGFGFLMVASPEAVKRK